MSGRGVGVGSAGAPAGSPVSVVLFADHRGPAALGICSWEVRRGPADRQHGRALPSTTSGRREATLVGIVEQELWSMKTITLGRSGLQVSRIAFGTWQLGRGLEKFAADRGMTLSQVAIAWTLANPAVHVAIVGARRSQHVEESLAAADVSLTGADLAGIDAIMAAAVQVTGPSPDSV
jgi:hypothetical protein